MARLVFGERIGKQGKLIVGCSAVIFDPPRQKILLTRRSDNGRWCLPGGQMESGESVTEACEREVREETGLQVRVVRLLGVYSDPHRLVEYADGNRYHVVSLNFEAEPIGGTITICNETIASGYFARDEIGGMDVMEHLLERIEDAFARQEEAFVR